MGASRPATGKVSLTRAVGLQKLRDLDFATVTATTAGTATINPNTDVLNTTGGVLLLTGSPKAAQYRLTTAGLTLLVSINIPTAPITLTRVGGTPDDDRLKLEFGGAVAAHPAKSWIL